MQPLLCAEHLSIAYEDQEVVHDVSFELEEGKILGIVGESGSGKSTILNAIIGLLGQSGSVTGGDVLYRGRSLVDLVPSERRKLLGPEIAVVQQDCQSAFCPVRRVGAQIHESLSEHRPVKKAESFRLASEMMKKIGLTDPKRVWDSYPFELSGGMNQRVGICTAMLQKPSLLLADEPTSALDVTVQKQVIEEMLLMRQEYHTAMIVVTHNIGVVRALADQVLVLQHGTVQDYGPTEQVLNHSKNAYTKRLMDSVLRLKREQGGVR